VGTWHPPFSQAQRRASGKASFPGGHVSSQPLAYTDPTGCSVQSVKW